MSGWTGRSGWLRARFGNDGAARLDLHQDSTHSGLVRIFDTFPFDGELDLLEYRLKETFDLVDHFVLVEAGETYRGGAKEFTFAGHEARFGWARSKIRHVRLESLGPKSSTPRERAAVQRNALLLALADARPDDVVLLLDVDEVPSRSLLEGLRGDGLDRPRRLAMTRHYGFADTLGPRSPCCPDPEDPFPAAAGRSRPGPWEELDSCWHGQSGVAAPVAALDGVLPFDLRFGLPPGEPIAGAGRHFTSVDPSTRLERKLKRVFHSEFDGPRETSPEHLERCRRHGIHHRGWWYAERPPGPLPEDLARLLRDHPRLAASKPRPAFARRLVRSWAWLRLWKGLPDALVTGVDRRFERLAPLLALPLLLCDLGRGALAASMRAAGLRFGRARPNRHF
jgi:beta-1,4-mannosyl-glycoprotein beta-1,4-N-acetylglucosaminyltransferase